MTTLFIIILFFFSVWLDPRCLCSLSFKYLGCYFISSNELDCWRSWCYLYYPYYCSCHCCDHPYHHFHECNLYKWNCKRQGSTDHNRLVQDQVIRSRLKIVNLRLVRTRTEQNFEDLGPKRTSVKKFLQSWTGSDLTGHPWIPG